MKTKYNIIKGQASFHATAKQIRAGLGSNSTFNAACIEALHEIKENGYNGICATFCGLTLQMSKIPK